MTRADLLKQGGILQVFVQALDDAMNGQLRCVALKGRNGIICVWYTCDGLHYQ